MINKVEKTFDFAVEKAFDFANDLTKQLITLSTGIIFLITTFSQSISSQNSCAYWVMIIALGFNGLSVVAGILTLMALTGTLGQNKPEDLSIYTPNITTSSVIQVSAFLIGLVLLIVYLSIKK